MIVELEGKTTLTCSTYGCNEAIQVPCVVYFDTETELDVDSVPSCVGETTEVDWEYPKGWGAETRYIYSSYHPTGGHVCPVHLKERNAS